MSRENFNHAKQSGKLKSPDDDDEYDGHNPTNLETIDLRAALLFNETRLLAFNGDGELVLLDKTTDNLESMANPKEYRWDWTIKLCHPVFEHMFWLSCDTVSVQIDAENHNLALAIPKEGSQPAILMVEPWSGHLHVYDEHLPRNCNRWLKLCDIRGTVILIPPNSTLLQDPDVVPMTLTGLSFCTRDPTLTFSKKVKRISDALGKAVLNDVVAQHSDPNEMD